MATLGRGPTTPVADGAREEPPAGNDQEARWMGTPRLLLVHAHPDDESLWTGGLTARHVDAGGEADLVMCTWAEGTIRHRELTDAVDILGMPRPPIMLGYADDRRPESAPDAPRLCAASFDELVRALTAHIRDLSPTSSSPTTRSASTATPTTSMPTGWRVPRPTPPRRRSSTTVPGRPGGSARCISRPSPSG